MSATVLIVDDDRAFRELLVEILEPKGLRLLEADSAEAALAITARQQVDLVLSDQRMPGMDGLELARRLRDASRPPEVLLMTAYGTIPQAVEAMRSGAVDYLTKPLESPGALRRLVDEILDRRRRSQEQEGPAGRLRGDEFLTCDAATLEVLALADRAAATDATVLISGESGTGKELLAHRIHRRSRRREGPFVVVDSAALVDSLAESELFGHEKGAFTGAVTRHRGRFEQADNGTLFLDEIGELSQIVQAKLLRVLETGRVERVGGVAPLEVDFRLVAATNRDLDAEVRRGRFRADLFFRLDVVHLRVPPLRQRSGDLELLATALSSSLAEGMGRAAPEITADALDLLQRYDWPGNVRELRNVLERALVASSAPRLTAADFGALAPGKHRESGPSAGAPSADSLSLEEQERQAISEALRRTGGHRERAAELLGISVRTLYHRLKKLGGP